MGEKRYYPSFQQALLLVLMLLGGIVVLGIILSAANIPDNTLMYVPLKRTAYIVISCLIIRYALQKSDTSLKLIFSSPGNLKYFIPSTIILAVGAAMLHFSLTCVLYYYLYNITSISIEDLALLILVDFLFVSTVTPILEEVIFRGIILKGFLNNYNVPALILVSSALFGAMHIYPNIVLSGTLLSMLISYIFVQTKSLWMCIIFHSIINLMVPESYVTSFLLSNLGFNFKSYVVLGALIAISGLNLLNRNSLRMHNEEASKIDET